MIDKSLPGIRTVYFRNLLTFVNDDGVVKLRVPIRSYGEENCTVLAWSPLNADAESPRLSSPTELYILWRGHDTDNHLHRFAHLFKNEHTHGLIGYR